MIERRIKELSFALEALSRINHYEASDLFHRIGVLLKNAVSEAEEPKPAIVYTSHKPTTTDDDIPF